MSRQTMLLSILAAVLVVALWWIFLYSPGQEDLARVEEEIAAAQTEQASLRQRVAQLESVRSEAPEIEAAIARLQSLVPDSPALPAALRQVQAAADDAGMTFESVATTRPVVADEGVGLYSLNLSMSADGSYFQIVDFLRRIEDPTITARGIIFNSLNMSVGEYPQLALTLNGQMFATLPPPPEPGAAPAPAPADDGESADGDAATDETGDEG